VHFGSTFKPANSPSPGSSPLPEYGTHYTVDIYCDIQKATSHNNYRLSQVADVYVNIIGEIKKHNPSFDPEKYIIKANEGFDKGGLLKFNYYINDDIRTSSVYFVFVTDNKVEYISDRSSDIDQGNKLEFERNVVDKANTFAKEGRIEEINTEIEETYDNNSATRIVNKNGYFFYDYDELALYYILEYTLQYDNLDSVLSGEEYRVRIE